MSKYINKISIEEIKCILSYCNLEAVTFNNSSSFHKTDSGIYVVCVKTDSVFYKDVLEWKNNKNSNGELIISYIEKQNYKDFVLLYFNDFYVKILNNKNNFSKLEFENNNLLNVKLNSYFLKTMLNKFKNSNYKLEFCTLKKDNIQTK